MHRLGILHLLELCLSNCYLLILVFIFVFCSVLPDEIAIFLYWDNDVFLYAKFFKIMNFASILIWPKFKLLVDFTFYLAHLEMSHYRVNSGLHISRKVPKNIVTNLYFKLYRYGLVSKSL